MSSDSSDDEFSYTNTASMLKKMAQKINTHESDLDTSTTENVSTDNKRKSDVIEVEDEVVIITNKTKKTRKTVKGNVTSVEVVDLSHVESEPNLDESFNIISQIDACLERNNTRGRGRRGGTGKGRGKGKKSPKNTRRVTRSMQPIDTIEIDPDYPILNSNNTENYPEEVNYEINLKVLWKSQTLKRFEVKRFQKLDVIFKYFAEQENVSEERLLFTLKDKIICKSDTPYSLNITAASIIDGGILSEKSYLSSAISYNSDSIKLKVQMKDMKKPFVFNIKVTDPLKILMSQIAELIDVPMDRLKFYFDGDVIQPSDSPVHLQLEGGECIDCVQIKK